MKRVISLAAVFLLLCMLPLTAQAEEQLTVSVKTDDMIYVTITLDQPVEGTTMGVSTSFDAGLLEPVASASEWVADGMLSDFNEKGMGVWTTAEPVKLEGDMVMLAFRPLSDQAFTTDLLCTLIVKNGAEEVGKYDTTCKVTWEGKTGETKPAQTATEPAVPAATEPAKTPTATEPKPSQQLVSTFDANATDATETASYSESPDGVLTVGATEPQKTDNAWLLWTLGGVVVVAAAAAVVMAKRKK